MKFTKLRNALQTLGEKYFAEGKPLAFLYPLYDAADTFFFTPNQKTSGSVHVRDFNDFKRVMITVVLALIPCALVGIYNVGLQANLLLAESGGKAPQGEGVDSRGAVTHGFVPADGHCPTD